MQDALYKIFPRGESGFHAADVAAVAGIDFDRVAFIHEQRNTYLGASLYSGGLEGVGGCIAFDTGLGICDLEHSLDRHFSEKNGISRCIAHNLHGVAFFHEVGTGNELLVDGNLLVGLVVHEDIIATVGVKILIWAALHSHVLEFLANVEAAFENSAVNHVLKLCAHESIAFAGLYVEEFHAEIKTAVHADAGAVLDVLSVNHKLLVIEFCRKGTHFSCNGNTLCNMIFITEIFHIKDYHCNFAHRCGRGQSIRRQSDYTI